MKPVFRVNLLIAIILLSTSFPILTCSSESQVTSQGLYWNLTTDTSIFYNTRRIMTQMVASSNRNDSGFFSVVISEYPEIPDPLSSFDEAQLTLSSDCVRFQLEGHIGFWFGVPLGNWSLLSILVSEMSHDNHTYYIIEEEETWGFTEVVDWDCCMMWIQYIDTIFKKADGSLQLYRSELLGANEYNETIIVTRGLSESVFDDSQVIPILGVISISAIVILLPAIPILRKRNQQ